MSTILEKVERRLGEKLFLKGERCAGSKCALIRRGYPPGIHGKTQRRGRGLSEYRRLQQEKQKIRIMYGLDDKILKRYTRMAASKAGIFSSNFWQILEKRLDNVVYRLGFARSRAEARHIINHSHVMLNRKIVRSPSYQVKKGDAISIKEASLKSPRFAELDLQLKKIEPPVWLSLDKTKKAGKALEVPTTEELEAQFDATKIKEFYSR